MTDLPNKAYFERTLDLFLDAGVKFVVIGGLAMNAHGSAYVTFDIDLCYDRSAENIRRLVTALKPFHPRLRGAPPDLPFKFDEETVRHGLNFTLTTDLGDLDLLGEVAGVGFYPTVVGSSAEIDVVGRLCDVLSLDGLIASKRAAGREKDRVHLKELEGLREVPRVEPGNPFKPK